MKKILLIHILLLTNLLLTNYIHAQEIKLSQYLNSPLTLNPANTGLTGNYRITSSYIAQWPSINDRPTGAVLSSFETPLLKRNHKSYFAIGAFAIYDKPHQAFNFKTVALSAAYHYKVGKQKHPTNTISIGIQPYLISKTLYSAKLEFHSPLPNIAWDWTYFPDEFRYIDVNAGINWNGFIGTKFNYGFGTTFKNFTRSKEDFLKYPYSSATVINFKYGINANAKLQIGKRRLYSSLWLV
jgi:type IX secretion system PorP/SprF family membrane protein